VKNAVICECMDARKYYQNKNFMREK